MVVLRTIAAVILAVALTEASLQQPPRDGRPLQETAAALLTQAHEHYKARRWRRAIDTYEAARTAEPSRFTAHLFLGRCYDQLYDRRRAGQPLNDSYLVNAIRNYELAAKYETDPQMKRRALQYLVVGYGPERLNRPSHAALFARQLFEMEQPNR